MCYLKTLYLVEPPRFTKTYYNADYSVNAEGIEVITSEEITIDYENYELVTLRLEGGMFNIFLGEAVINIQ